MAEGEGQIVVVETDGVPPSELMEEEAPSDVEQSVLERVTMGVVAKGTA